MSCKSIFRVLPAVVTAVGPLANTNAQEQAASGVLEEIVVTARRREETLQEIPLSVEAYLADEMELRGMERIEDVVAATPNVFAAGGLMGAAASGFSMRGIPNVGFFVDGIWQQSNRSLMQRGTLELERVELLRGPQGTLYGRDSTGGAIRLYTRRPAEEFGVRVTATTGSYDRVDVTVNADIPLTDTFFTKWTVSRQQRDGYVQSLTVDRAYGEIDDEFVRGDFLWSPTDRLSFRLILEDSLVQTSQTNTIAFIDDPGLPGVIDPGYRFVVPTHQYYELAGFPYNNLSHTMGWPGGEVGKFQTKSGYNATPHGVFVDAEAWTLNIEYDITESITLTSLTGWREQREAQFTDFDGSEFEFVEQDNMLRIDWLTQEFQVTGGQGRINWVAGLYAWESNAQGRQLRWGLNDFDNKRPPFGPVSPGQLDFNVVRFSPQCRAWTPRSGLIPCVAVPPSQDQFSGASQEGYAVFGEGTFDLTDTLSLTLGARYHDQDNETHTELFAADTPRRTNISGERLPGDYFKSAGTANSVPLSFDQDTYRFALTNQFNDDLMAYIGFSEGFNSGGLNRVRILDENANLIEFDFPFHPESIENLEIGIRSGWLNRRLRLNATVFNTEWNDIQLSSPTRNPFRPNEFLALATTANVAAAEAKGAEINLISQPSPRFRLDFNVGILDTEYTEVQPGVTDVSLGDKFGRAPDLQYTLGGQWNANTPDGGGVTLRLDYNWTDDYIRNYSPLRQANVHVPGRFTFEQESFGLVNARATYRAPTGQWEVSIFGTNLTDELYMNGGFFPPQLQLDHSTIGRPREAGVTVRASFE